MMCRLPGLIGAAVLLLGLLGAGSGCTPTDRNFASGGAGGAGGAGGSGCPAGFAECDGNPDTICETDTATDMAHCGTCDHTCDAVADGNIACVAGTCSITSCNNGRANCDNFYDNGCETNPSTNFDHCGGCGQSCEDPTAITACVSGKCQLAQCVGTNLDCDMNASNGCEVDPASNVDHCGGCGMACMGANATMACVNSACSIASCNANFGDCNMMIADGCEIEHLSSPFHCASCGNICSGGGCRNGVCTVPELVVDTKFAPGEILIFKDEMLIGSRATGEVWRTSIVLSGMPTLIGATATGPVNALSATASTIFVAGSMGTARMDWTGMNQYNYGTVTARAVDTDGTLVYWTASNAVRNGPVAGGTANTFFSHGGLLSVLGLALNGTDAYWGLSDGTIWKSAKTPVMAGKIGTGPTNADNLVVDGTTIYWSSGKGIHSMSTKGGATTDLAPASTTVRALAVDAMHVYWTDESAGLIQRVLKDGSGKPEILAIQQAKPWGLALTTQFIYWANGGNGTIVKLPK